MRSFVLGVAFTADLHKPLCGDTDLSENPGEGSQLQLEAERNH
jgi:hypothetical protein